jgi:arginyl-tRNA synthetase
MNIFNIFKDEFKLIIINLADNLNIQFDNKKLDIFTFEPCKEEKNGDIATNIAMIFAKDFKKSPRDLAKLIIDQYQNDIKVNNIEIAGPGFINIVLKFDILQKFLLDILQKEQISLPKISNGQKINIEYASPNPTGPMHIGHARGAIYGDILANLLQKTGFDVTKEYYINDAGLQINNLVKSVYLRYLELFGKKIIIEEGLYPGQYLIPIAQKIKDQYQEQLINKKESEYFNLICDFVVDEMVQLITSDLAKMGIKHDILFSEKKQLHNQNKIAQAIDILDKKGLIYKGIIEAPKGKKIKDFKSEEQLLFRSTNFGDDMDRVVQKSDGSYTYFAADIAYCLNKFERGATKMILPLGFDHSGYVKRLTAAAKAITDNRAEIKIILCQMVKFLKDGENLKMSKRSGNFIAATDVIDEVGSDILRFMMMSRKNDVEINFDLEEVVKQSKDNPIFYVQYAHTRCHSVFRNLEEKAPHLMNIFTDPVDYNILKNLTSNNEISLIKKLTLYPRIIEMAVDNFEPHRIAFYLQEIAAQIHSLWNAGIEDDNLRFIIKNNDDLTRARIYLLMASAKIISSALEIFNIKALTQML